MAENKTTRTENSVEDFLASVPEPRQSDAREVDALLTEVTGLPAALWGPSIVGYGKRHLVYESGRELDWFEIGFSPRKASTTLYLTEGFDGYDELLGRLGKHTTGKSCLYLKRLDDVDRDVLKELVTRSVSHLRGS
ncbi:uncharacterized protein DUF1801 [Kribbella orskensis]|uniref:Uncharacterized protein DUF1801 n=1 Tax=Kribbella orskensis TaxID=2512216 RepID=A0ABY2BIG3_9ACTN|nr:MULTISPECIES: DUF1801 domain-containing protein [Kribbella]TCN38646.1 uncharacterized protein DUF1801 [Kribbella sp. VKM Ac-2500]TCO20827.1 uncharacterized protein DUF1801 [Kribbella orskensis]